MENSYYYYDYDKKIEFQVSDTQDPKILRDLDTYLLSLSKIKKFDRHYLKRALSGDSLIRKGTSLSKEIDDIDSFFSLVRNESNTDPIYQPKSTVLVPSGSVIVGLQNISRRYAAKRMDSLLRRYEAYFAQQPAPNLLKNCYVLQTGVRNRLDTLDLCVALKEEFYHIIEYAVPNFYTQFQTNAVLPDDPLIRKQWYLFGSSNPAISGCDVLEAWEICRGLNIDPGRQINVAVIDTGNFDHEDLPVASLLARKSLLDSSLDPVRIDNKGSEFHGTAVSGIIGSGINNRLGTAGIAPNANIVSLKTLPVSLGQIGKIISALGIAAANNCRVINMSFGTNQISGIQPLDLAINAAAENALICCSSGNYDPTIRPDIMYPANLPSVLCIGACDHLGKYCDGTFGDFISGFMSNRTVKKVDLVAPGLNIVCTKRGAEYFDESGFFSGTSAATAIVSGIGALLLSINPNLNMASLKSLLRSSCDLVTGQDTDKVGKGRIHAGRAARRAAATR